MISRPLIGLDEILYVFDIKMFWHHPFPVVKDYQNYETNELYCLSDNILSMKLTL